MKDDGVVLIDFDGTLVDSIDVKISLLARSFSHLNVNQAHLLSILKETYDLPRRRRISHAYLHIFNVNIDLETLNSIENNFLNEMGSAMFPLAAGAKNFVTKWSQVYNLVLFSSADHHSAINNLHCHGLQHHFGQIYFDVEDKLAYLKQLISTGEIYGKLVLSIGDSKLDYEVAHTIGIPFWSFQKTSEHFSNAIGYSSDFDAVSKYLLDLKS